MQQLRQGILALITTIIFLLPTAVGAVQVGLSAPIKLVGQGNIFEVNLTVSGLGNGTAPSLGVFDTDILFNPLLLGFSSVSFGDPLLGDQLDLFSVGAITQTTTSSGLVNLFELSIDSPGDLNSLQADAFILATLKFDALAPGTAEFGISVNAFGDALGNPLQIDSIISDRVEIAPVPEPSTFLLLSVSFAGCMIIRRRFVTN
jgi:hypothetical protein